MDFSKSKKVNEAISIDENSKSSETESFIGKSIKVKGNISSEQSIRIEGKITGNITSNNSITIGKSGISSGRLEAEYINILGNSKGTIVSGKKLNILSNAKFNGNITSPKVIIDEGGIFNGNMNMLEKKGK